MLQEITTKVGARTQTAIAIEHSRNAARSIHQQIVELQSKFTPAVITMVKPWLTGDDEKDARSLSRSFRMIGFSISEWRQLVEVSK